ncbi:hypothetical protein [Metaclostridioides mangenotii]|uniref:lysine 5,6-aminomutase reactivase subunit KamB n=1 Tax=Metaclostridioides mangenotii TaxID=1540 RepID=UPI0026EB5622|nr:hypothetical protein [Clostridioides mangenotii]
MNILDEILRYNSLSIIGNYKNVGKTTTLNYILKECLNKNIVLGLTSIGVDGEGLDIVTKTQKPRIYVNKDTIIATATNLALSSDITKEILELTGITTPMGNIVIFRSLSDGYVELAGPSINTQIKYICERLKYYGADLSMVDGALSRKTLGSPSITDSTIFCSGAVIDKDINKAVEKIVFEANILNLAKTNDEKFYEIYENLKTYKVSLVNKDYSFKFIDIKTTLNSSKEIIKRIDQDTKYVVVDGIVSNEFINNFIKSGDEYKNITILVSDSTKIFLDKEIFDKFIKLKGNIKVINKVNLIGLSINPTSIEGYSFDNKCFIESIQNKIDIRVFNVAEI